MARKTNKFHMRREVSIKQIIEALKKYPPETTVTVMTKQQVEIVGFVLKLKDGGKQITEIASYAHGNNVAL